MCRSDPDTQAARLGARKTRMLLSTEKDPWRHCRTSQIHATLAGDLTVTQMIIDPRNGDIEDDASSTKRRSMFSLAGSLLAEISILKLAIAWTLLIGLPGLVLGTAPLLVSFWIATVSLKASAVLTGITPIILLGFWWPRLVRGRPVLRLIENSFWSLNALGVQPAYIICREGLRHAAEGFLPLGVSAARRASVRAASAAASGVAVSAAAFSFAALAWPASRWLGSSRIWGRRT